MDELTKEELDQLLSVFRDQALGILEEMSQDMLSLEVDPGDSEAMARLRRSAHTIKGDAACVGLAGVTELAHRLEDVIDEIRAGELGFETAVVNALLEGLDEMRTAIGGETIEDVSPVALERVFDTLAALLPDHGEDDVPREAIQLLPARRGPAERELLDLAPFHVDRVKDAVIGGQQVYLLSPGGKCSQAELESVLSEGAQVSVLAYLGENGMTGFLVATRLSPDGVLAWLQSRAPDGTRVAKVDLLEDDEVTLVRIDRPAKQAASPRRGPAYVRIEAGRIDALLNLAGEMVIARSVMNQVAPELERAFPKNEVVTRFSAASAQMGKLIAELQKGVLKMRMVTIDHVFRRFARPMRELAGDSGKRVDLVVSGGETELDRTLVDLIYEPLLHLLRNAVDHGIETAEEREAFGKPPEGKIGLRAYHEGNQVVVEVSDDGRGVDAESLKSRALQAGLITLAQAEQMGREDAIELMFLQGLSTAKEITTVSGRGVGAAAVKSVIEELRGTVSVKTEAGAGTTFVLRMPLTLAIIKALLFTVADQFFALPLLAVSEVAHARASDLVYLDGFESFRLRDRFVSVVRPAVVLGMQQLETNQAQLKEFFLVVASVAGKRFGITADALIGEQEVVIKPLDSQWLQNEALAGASVLGDGSVVLILDGGSMLRKAVRWERTRETALALA